MPESCLVPCTSCGALNRVPDHIEQGKAKCGKCSTVLNHKDPVHEVNGAVLAKAVLNSPIPVVVDFWAPWCGPCVGFAPTFKQYATAQRGKALFLKCDTEAHQDAGNRFGIRSIPTLIVFENEKEKARQSGALSYPHLEKWVAGQVTLNP
ncbi:MAG: thioredoxin TrxC [Betaproteobacteria bacterium]|nr:thioredoxin TrxC [Betaproteobacteria bacterium]